MIESAEEFARLRTSELSEEQHRATHDEAPESVWRAVIERFTELREWVAHNKTVPLVILELLSRDPDDRVRYAVAMKNKIPDDLQLLLARDSDESVRARIAYNKKATKKALQILADDGSQRIRQRAIERLQAGEYVA